MEGTCSLSECKHKRRQSWEVCGELGRVSESSEGPLMMLQTRRREWRLLRPSVVVVVRGVMSCSWQPWVMTASDVVTSECQLWLMDGAELIDQVLFWIDRGSLIGESKIGNRHSSINKSDRAALKPVANACVRTTTALRARARTCWTASLSHSLYLKPTTTIIEQCSCSQSTSRREKIASGSVQFNSQFPTHAYASRLLN